ncbi:VWA domain-containing protein [Bremerella cremea]|uniref:VWA domain-containing protein n=1 Tax=Bremerella cremea TaxID=1031537 RepID=UPI0031ED9B86
MADWREGAGKPKKPQRKPANDPQPTPAKPPRDPSDWRGKKRGEPAPTGQRASEKSYLRENKSNGPKNIGVLNLLLFSLAILTGSFIAIIGCQPTKTPMLHMATLEHDDPLWAPNAFALEDLNNFTLSMEDPGNNIELYIGQGMAAGSEQQKPWINLDDDEFTSAINRYLDLTKAPGGPRPGGWVFYFSCHGVTNYDGVPYLVAKNSRALSPERGNANAKLVPLTTVLQAISDHPTIKRYPKSYKLLVFDMGRMESQWSANRLYNNFPSSVGNLLKTLPQDIQLSNTHLLLSSSDGQKSWANPHDGGTNFGLLFGKGLLGDADQMPTSVSDDSVSLSELNTYLLQSVDNWAMQHRNSRQTPQLYSIGQSPPPDQILLSRVGDAKFQIKPNNASNFDGNSPDQKRLADLWDALQLLGENGALQIAPARFSLVQYELLRAESMTESGMWYQAELTQILKSVHQAMDDLAMTIAQYNPVAEQVIVESTLPFFEGSGLQRELGKGKSYALGSLACWRLLHPEPITHVPTLAELKTNADKIAEEAKKPDTPADKQTKPLHCEDYYSAAEFLLDGFTKANQRDMTPENIELILNYLQTAPNSPVQEANQGTHVVEVEQLLMLANFQQTLATNFGIDAASYDATPYRNAMVDVLQCRRRLERLAFTADQRVFPWLVPSLDNADSIRREAEDYLYALQPDKTLELLGPLTGAANGFQDIASKKERLTRAYRAVDSVRISVPYLISWLTHHPYGASDRELRLNQATTALERSHDLAAALSPRKLEGESQPNYGKAPIPEEDLIREIEQNYAEVVRFLNRESQDILDAQGGKNRSDSETLLEIHDLLRVRYVARLTPSMATYDRNSLRAKQIAIAGQSLGNVNLKPVAQSPLILGLSSFPKGPWQLALNQVGGAGDFQIAPIQVENEPAAAALLKATGPTVEFALNVEEQALASSLAPARSIESFPSATNATAVTAFTGVVVSDQARIAGNRTTPPQIEYRIQRKEHFAWYAFRAMEDFWGNDSLNPYFDRSAEAYLGPFSQESVNATSELASTVISRLRQLRKDYPRWVDLGNPPESISDSKDDIHHKLTIHFPQSIPAGLSSIDLLANQGKAVDTSDSAGESSVTHTFQTQPAGIFQPQRPFLQIIPTKAVAQSTETIERIRFRGNARRFPLEISGTKRPDSIVQIVDVNPFPFRQPTVSVDGELSGTADVIFILDCSATMSKIVPGTPPASRMSIAKGVLQDILGTMASPKGQFRVLTYAFGSRVGWDADNQAIQRPGVNVPAGIVPANDVMPLVNANLAPLLNHSPRQNEPGVDVARIQDAIEELDAFGETPLYYSIYLALQKVDPTKPTQIIVITDGANDQADDPTSRPFRKSAINLIDEFNKPKYANTQLQVVGFALGEQARNLQTNPSSQPPANTLAEIAWLAKEKARGGFIPADQQIELRRRIEELINIKVYFSVQRSDDPSQPTPHEFGSLWYAKDSFENQRHDYTVRELRTDDTAKIQLRGGEKVRLTYDDEINQMVFQDDQAEEAARAKISVDDALGFSGEYIASILNFQAPDPDTGTLEIPVRLENTNDTQFTVRPFHIWAEIQPSVTNAFAPNELFETRYFSDLLLRNETQFPEFLLELNQWQSAAKWARIKVYTQVEKPIQPAKTVSLKDLLVNNVTNTGADFAAGNFTVETSTSLDQYKYQIVVRVEPGSQGIQPHHVGIVPAPPRIQRTYDIAGDGSREILSITHRFMYESKNDVEASDHPRVEIWTRDQLTTGAPSFSVDVQIPKW